jgi:hypothetical protein
MDMERDLADLVGRDVDLLTIGAILTSDNDELRDEVLESREAIYAEQT